jgi:proteasome assembly chaperone (PAC2) family protein
MTHLFLVDPVVRGLLPGLHLLGLEPESDLLLGGLDGVGAVADVAADVLRKKNKSQPHYPSTSPYLFNPSSESNAQYQNLQ